MKKYNFEVFKRPTKVDGKFDRKADYGENHPTVDALRRRGWTRRLELARREREGNWKYPNKYFGVESTALIELNYFTFDSSKKVGGLKGKTFLDIGCGYSPDAQIAKLQGAKTSYRLDLYKSPLWEGDAKLIIADYCERIPLENNSVDVVVAQATLNLNSKRDRIKAYKQIKRVLKKGGFFSFYMCSLLNEHDWDLADEVSTLHDLGFAICHRYGGGAVMQLVRKR